jgi:hypothetical protein
MDPFQSYIYVLVVLGTSLCFFRPFVIYLQDPLQLRRFPKPSWTVGLSSLWLVRITWPQRRSRILHEHFQKLGDVIRVAPNQIIFNSPEAIKDIYGVLASTRGVVKDELYDRMAGDGAHDLVQLRDRNEHSSRRKAIANAFAAKTVVNMEPVIGKAVAQLIQNLDGFVEEKRAVNIRYWCVGSNFTKSELSVNKCIKVEPLYTGRDRRHWVRCSNGLPGQPLRFIYNRDSRRTDISGPELDRIPARRSSIWHHIGQYPVHDHC